MDGFIATTFGRLGNRQSFYLDGKRLIKKDEKSAVNLKTRRLLYLAAEVKVLRSHLRNFQKI